LLDQLFQNVEARRLLDEVIESGSAPVDLAFSPSGKANEARHSKLRAGAQLTDQLIAAHIGQSKVDDRDVGRRATRRGERLLRGTGDRDHTAYALEQHPQQGAAVLVIVDDQYAALRTAIGF